MFYVIWDDHTGQRHERLFENAKDARLEAKALMKRGDMEHVEYGTVEEVSKNGKTKN